MAGLEILIEDETNEEFFGVYNKYHSTLIVKIT